MLFPLLPIYQRIAGQTQSSRPPHIMSVCVVEFQVITNERLQSFPLVQRVVRLRTYQQSLQAADSQPQLGVQKIRPATPLNDDELRLLKISNKVLEKYPSITEYLNSYQTAQDQFFTPNIFVPANQESAQILSEIHIGQLNQQIFIVSPVTVQFITGMCFDKNATMLQMYDIISQNFTDNFVKTEDLFVNTELVHFADSLQPITTQYQQRQEEMVSNDTETNQEMCLQNTLMILNMLKKHYKKRFYEVLVYFTDLYLDYLSLNTVQGTNQIIRIEATQMLQSRQLEQLGLKYLEIQDIKHIYPNVTLVKVAPKVSAQDKVEQIQQNQLEGKHAKTASGQIIKLLSKPLVVDKFLVGPFYLIVKDVENNTESIQKLKDALQIINNGRKGEPFKLYNKQKLQISFEDGTEAVKSTVDQQFLIAVTPFSPAEQEGRHILSQMSDVLGRGFEFGVVSEVQLQLITRGRRCAKEVQAEPRPASAHGYGLGTHYYGQSYQGYGHPHDPYDVPKQQLATGYQMRGNPTPGPAYLNRGQVQPPEPQLTLREQKARCRGIQLRDLPSDVKVKDIAGFCKNEKIADLMAWNLHQPFNVAQGPIRMAGSYVLILFVSQQAAEKAVQILNKAYFRNKPVSAVLSNDPNDQLYIEQCFQLKDPVQFTPAYIVVMKQINVPHEAYKLIDVIQNDWKLPRPDLVRVRNDNAICFYKNEIDANIFFRSVRKDFFTSHLNDIFRMDIDE